MTSDLAPVFDLAPGLSVDTVAGVVADLPPGPVVLTVPTVWGTPRCERLRRAVGRRPTTLLPRAIAIARSHSDGASTICVVVEPGIEVPGEPPNWLVHRLHRGAAGWELHATTVRELSDAHWPDHEFDDAAAIFVVEPETDLVEWLNTRTTVGRILPVDAHLIRRYGADPGVPRRPLVEPEGRWVSDVDDAEPPRRRRALAALTVAAVLAAGAVAVGMQATEPPPGRQPVLIGRATVSMPAGWRRSDLAAQPGSPARVVFVEPSDGRRIIVVETRLRGGSTPETVARSLANRIAQRGDDAVAEFAPSMRVGGRTVIAYRETPQSGSPIAWYVLVERSLQVSIGCQAGAAAQSVQRDCVSAVQSVTID